MENDRLDAALSRLYQQHDVPESFETGWRAAVRREETIQRMKTRKNGWMKRLVPALAALVLVVGGLWAGEMDLSAPQAETGGAMVTSRSSNKMLAVEEAAYDTGAVMYSAASVSDATAFDGTTLEAQENRKIVRTADITLRTAHFDEALAQARALLESMGGYVENLYQYGDSARHATIGMRIPSDKLDAFLSGAESIGRVTNRSESSTDMTTQYVDNQARLDTLYAKRDRLNELLIKAEDVSDLIEIESAIADTQYQIDSFESTQRSIDNRVDMSQVSLNIVEETPASTAAADVSLGERLSAALEVSLEWLGQLLRGMLVFVVMILPVAAPVAAIAVVWCIVRRIRRNKKEA